MYRVGIIGATGNVGSEILEVLAERKFPASEVIAFASEKNKNKEVSYGDRVIKTRNLDGYDFTGTDIVFVAAGSDISKRYSEQITNSKCIMIDNSSMFRMDPDVPLIIPEVNPKEIVNYSKKNIIANPNCSTIQMLVPLKPLHDVFGIKRIVVSTYQAVSGRGKEAMDELYHQTKKMFEGDLNPKSSQFTKRIAFNCIPHIDIFMDSGDTKEEWKMNVETKKILDPNVEVSATCVRVPVFSSHSESVNVQFAKPFQIDEVFDILNTAPGVLVLDRRDDGGYMTPIEAVKDDNVFVSRIRIDNTIENGLNMWIVTDCIRKGGALNAVQIAELLIERL